MSTVQSPVESTAPQTSLNLGSVLQKMLAVSDKVSDLIFSPGRPPQIELVGKLQPVEIPGLDKLTPPQTAAIAKIIIGAHEEAAQSLEKYGSADLSFSVPSLCRFRVNIFKQRGTHAIVMRVIPTRPPNFADFDLPPQMRDIVELKNGIVLVTGPTGSGKSSTLAAVIDLINETKYYHIVTIEDPIEFLHAHKNSTIHQRELHSDTPNFALALRAALRQAPKVILVGEMRDRETIEVAMEAAAYHRRCQNRRAHHWCLPQKRRTNHPHPAGAVFPLHHLATAYAAGRRQRPGRRHGDSQSNVTHARIHRTRRDRGQIADRRDGAG
jgi:twitching motility protein PilT